MSPEAPFWRVRPSRIARVGLYRPGIRPASRRYAPLGLWRFGARNGVFWIRLSTDPWFLVAFGVAALGISLGVLTLDRGNEAMVHLFRHRTGAGTGQRFGSGIAAGMGGALLVAAPFWWLNRAVPLVLRGGPVAQHLIPAILVFALLGNFMEELLLRGYVLGYLQRRRRLHRLRRPHSPRNLGAAALITPGIQSGVVFAVCHIFLASTVADVGAPPLLFTLWEGSIAGVVGERYGVLPATLTHGGEIFLLSSGLLEYRRDSTNR